MTYFHSFLFTVIHVENISESNHFKIISLCPNLGHCRIPNTANVDICVSLNWCYVDSKLHT